MHSDSGLTTPPAASPSARLPGVETRTAAKPAVPPRKATETEVAGKVKARRSTLLDESASLSSAASQAETAVLGVYEDLQETRRQLAATRTELTAARAEIGSLQEANQLLRATMCEEDEEAVETIRQRLRESRETIERLTAQIAAGGAASGG